MTLREDSEYLLQCLKKYESVARDAAISISGGIDSSVLFYLFRDIVNPYTAGVDNSKDMDYSKLICNELGKKLTEIKLNVEVVTEFHDIVKKIDPNIENVDVGFETVLAVVLGNIREDSLITGQGADEIFYGYAKFKDGRDRDNSLSLKKLKEKTLPRELRLAKYFGKTLIAPYLDHEIEKRFSSLSLDYHSKCGLNKCIIRECANVLGIPKEVVERPKKAAQYGSGIMKILNSSNRVRYK